MHNDKRGKLERQRPRFRLPSFWRNRRRPAIRSQIKQHSSPSLLDNYPGQGNCCAIRRAVTGGDNSGNGDFEPDCTGPRVTLYTSLEVGIGLRRRRRHAVPPHPRDRSIFAPAWTHPDPVDRDSSRNRFPQFRLLKCDRVRARVRESDRARIEFLDFEPDSTMWFSNRRWICLRYGARWRIDEELSFSLPKLN